MQPFASAVGAAKASERIIAVAAMGLIIPLLLPVWLMNAETIGQGSSEVEAVQSRCLLLGSRYVMAFSEPALPDEINSPAA